MKKLVLLFILLISAASGFSQGIQFEKNLCWTQILEKAKVQNKYIFVDCFATWCGPCKEMDKEVFSKPGIGAIFSKEFISIKIQFDSTKNDSEEVREKYDLARYLEKEYKVVAFPTYLFFNSNGELVSKEFGKITPDDAFKSKVLGFLNPSNQYYVLLEKYNAGDRSPELILKLVPEAVRLQHFEIAYKVHDQFVDLMTSPYSKDQLITMYASISNTNNKGYQLLIKHGREINNILGDEGRSEAVITFILKKEITARYFRDKKSIPNWKSIAKYAKRKAPKMSERIVMQLKVSSAANRKDFDEFTKLKLDYYDEYASDFDHNEKFFMNNELMEIFRVCNNPKLLKRAAEWSKTTIYRVPGEESPSAMDTYANLLYKAGERQDAIQWQRKAISLISKIDKNRVPSYANNLNKMLQGQPTWSN